MDQSSFENKVKSLAAEGRIGVSDRIQLFDEGKVIGLTRTVVDKLIDQALKDAKNPASSIEDTPTIPPVSPIPEVESFIPEVEPLVFDDSQDQPQIEPPIIENFAESTNDDEIDLSIDESNPEVSDEIQEPDSWDTFLNEPNPDPARIDESLEAEIKSAEHTFEELVNEEESVTESTEPAIQIDRETNNPLPEGLFALIGGGVSIIACTSMVGIIAAIAAIIFSNNGRKRIKQQGIDHYLKAHVTFLTIGQVLAWIGAGIYILIRVSGRFF